MRLLERQALVLWVRPVLQHDHQCQPQASAPRPGVAAAMADAAPHQRVAAVGAYTPCTQAVGWGEGGVGPAYKVEAIHGLQPRA